MAVDCENSVGTLEYTVRSKRRVF